MEKECEWLDNPVVALGIHDKGRSCIEGRYHKHGQSPASHPRGESVAGRKAEENEGTQADGCHGRSHYEETYGQSHFLRQVQL